MRTPDQSGYLPRAKSRTLIPALVSLFMWLVLSSGLSLSRVVGVGSISPKWRFHTATRCLLDVMLEERQHVLIDEFASKKG